MRAGQGLVRMCGKDIPAANVSYRNFTLKFGNDIPNQGGEITPGAEEEVPEENSEKPKDPIALAESQGVMDLSNLLAQNEKCMVVIGNGCWNCRQVAAYIDQVYEQHPDVQMIKYNGPNCTKFVSGQMWDGIAPYQSESGSFTTPITCFFEQKNLINTFCGYKLQAIEDALNALSAMTPSVSTT